MWPDRGHTMSTTAFDAKALPIDEAGILACTFGTTPSQTMGPNGINVGWYGGGLQLRDSSRFARDSLLATRFCMGGT